MPNSKVPFQSIDAATSFLLDQVEPLDVCHLSYWYLQFTDSIPDQVFWVATYDPEYMSYYMQNFTPINDPVMANVMEFKFIDWFEWFETDVVAQTITEIAPRYGITKFGISIPLPGPNEDKVVFSACMKSSPEKWAKDRTELARRILPFAQKFHERMKGFVEHDNVAEHVFHVFG